MKYFLATFVFLLAFGAHLYTMAPAVTEDDCGELSGDAATLGICHSPGYPLYSNIGKAVNTAVPMGNPAFRANLVGSLFIAGAALVLFIAIESVTGSIWSALALSLIFAFCGSVWEMSNIKGQVYGPAAFITALIALILVTEPAPAILMLLSFVFGIGITAHYNLGLLIPGLLWWVYAYRKRLFANENPVPLLLKYTLFFAAGLSIILFIYIRARQLPLFSWEDPQTLERFWHVVVRSRYGAMNLAQGGPPPLAPAVIWSKLVFFFQIVSANFTYIGAVLLLIGMIAWLTKDKARGWSFLLLAFVAGPGFLIMANAGLDTGSRELMDRFMYISIIFSCVIAAKGLSLLPKKLIPAAALLPLFLLFTNLQANSRRNEYLFNDYARNILKTTPENSVVFFDRADEMEFVTAYMKYALGKRPDITFVDCNASVSRSIYGDDYYMIWGKPRLQIRTRVESDIIRNSKYPVYYATFEPEMIPIPRYQEGLLYRAKPAQALKPGFPYSEVYAFRTDFNVIDNRLLSLLLSHYYLIGKYYLGVGKPALAERFFNGVEAYDERGKWIFNIGFQFHQAGFTDYALRHYLKSIDLGHADSSTYTNLGVVYKSKNDSKNARLMYGKAIEADPRNYQAYFNLAVLYWEEHNWNEVIKYLEQALRINPNSKEAAGYLNMARNRVNR